MSSWVVNKIHVDLVLTAALEWGYAKFEQADDLGAMVWAENWESYRYRYADTRPDVLAAESGENPDAIDSYVFERIPGLVDPEIIERAVASLRYQSSDHPGWPASQAKRWLDGLHKQALDRIGPWVKRYGPVDPKRQLAPGLNDWHQVTRLDYGKTTVSIECQWAWAPGDRFGMARTEKLRVRREPS